METLPLEVTRAASDLRALVGRLSRRLRQTSVVGEMTLSQASVLSLLEREGPATPGVLATRERISPQSMGAILISLEALGLVSRTPDPTDGRSLVHLTHRGRTPGYPWRATAPGRTTCSCPCRQLHCRRAADAYRGTSALGTPDSVPIRRTACSEHVGK